MAGFPILSAMTYAPLAGAVLIFFWPTSSPRVARWTALVASLVTLALSLLMIAAFNTSSQGMQFNERASWLPGVGASYRLGVDGISALRIVLTTLLTVIAIVASWDPVQHRVREYMITMLLLETGMLGVFVSLDLVLFYIFWEVTLVPMALMIGIWAAPTASTRRSSSSSTRWPAAC